MRPIRLSARLLPSSVRMLLAACAILSCLLPTGCVRRRLTIRTNPPGAQVFVDNQEIGTTPCSASFVYYGTRTITIIKDGYRTEKIFQRIPAPWYEIPPLDFFSENLNPLETRDERVVDVQLVPEEIVPQQQLLDRAQTLRDSARTGTVTPLTIQAAPATPPPQLGYPGQGLPGGQPVPYEPLPAAGPSPPPFRP
jgi:PEGA domain